MNIDEEIGGIINKFKNLEYYLNCIITNFISPKETAFFDNVVLNSNVMPTGNKIKVIKTICDLKNEPYNFYKLHQLLNLRNLFAHENWYMESSKKGMLITIDIFNPNAKFGKKYDIAKFEDKIKEFNEIYKVVLKEIMELNEKLSRNKNAPLH